MHAALRDRDWILNHMKIKRVIRDQAKNLPRQRRLVATSDSDECLLLERSRKHEVNVPNKLRVVDLARSEADIVNLNDQDAVASGEARERLKPYCQR